MSRSPAGSSRKGWWWTFIRQGGSCLRQQGAGSGYLEGKSGSSGGLTGRLPSALAGLGGFTVRTAQLRCRCLSGGEGWSGEVAGAGKSSPRNMLDGTEDVGQVDHVHGMLDRPESQPRRNWYGCRRSKRPPARRMDVVSGVEPDAQIEQTHPGMRRRSLWMADASLYSASSRIRVKPRVLMSTVRAGWPGALRWRSFQTGRWWRAVRERLAIWRHELLQYESGQGGCRLA